MRCPACSQPFVHTFNSARVVSSCSGIMQRWNSGLKGGCVWSHSSPASTRSARNLVRSFPCRDEQDATTP
jgi:hypothetical protein